MRGAAPILAAGLALALVAAAGVAGNRRQRELEQSPLPSVENGGARGLAAARAWLAATGRPHRILAAGGDGPTSGEVLLLVAPPAHVGQREAEAIAAHAERGGLVAWAMGPRAQPWLERTLGAERRPVPGDTGSHTLLPLVPHPLFERLSLRAGPGTLLPSRAGALPVAGDTEVVGALSVPIGAGEAIVLSGPDALENGGLGEGGDLGLLSRLAALGPIAIDQRYLAAPGAPVAASTRTAALLALQALLAAVLLLLALGRRLGAVRVAPDRSGGRTARDYLASLGDLYRRAGGEPELRASAWRSLRRALERRAGIPARANDDEAERRLAVRAPAAARAFALGRTALAAPPDADALLPLLRAAAEVEAALDRRTPAGTSPSVDAERAVPIR